MKGHLSMLLAVAANGCVGVLGAPFGDPVEDSEAPPAEAILPDPTAYALHLLTREELNATLRDLFGLSVPLADSYLPENMAKPFSNDLINLNPTQPVVYGVAQLAAEVAHRVVTTPSMKARVVSCTTQDAVCLVQVVNSFGKKVFRRPLSGEEVAELTQLTNTVVADATFDVALEVLLRAFIESPNFLYRSELGTIDPSGGPARLSPYEVASRLSYALWGTTPDGALLALADDGSILTSSTRLAKAQSMLADARATAALLRFHAEWLGYARMSFEPATAAAYKSESDLIVEDLLVRQALPWSSLLDIDSAPGVAAMSSVYGVDLGSDPAVWTVLPAVRRGILTRAAFLSNGAKAGDTSPTARGKFIRERLMCQVISPPPPGVQADTPPQTAGACKVDRYAAHRANPSCSSCHSLMDPVGFGLENYDRLGRWRSVEVDANGQPTACEISGQGVITNVGSFVAGAELEDLLVTDDRLEKCMSKQYLRYALGRRLLAAEADLSREVWGKYRDGARTVQALVLGYVAAEEFVLSRAEQAAP